MVYARTTWVDGSTGGTPINSARLNNMEQGLTDHESALANTLNQNDIAPVTGLRFGVQNFNVTPGSTQIVLAWDLPSSMVGINGFEVRYRTNTGGTLGTQTTVLLDPTAVTYTITGLTNSATYLVEVTPSYAVSATPVATPLFGDNFSGTATWNPSNPRTAADGTSSQVWTVVTASTTSPAWAFQLYSGAMRAAGGNQVTHAVLDAGATSGRRLRWIWSAMLSDTSKRRVGCIFRATNGDVNNCFFVSGSSGVWVVGKIVAGTVTTIFTSTINAVANDIVDVTLNASNAIVTTINGNALWSGTDASLASNTFCGWRGQAQASGQTYSQDQTTALTSFFGFSA